MSKPLTVHGYTEEQLMEMKPDDLRAIFHERTHHTVEVLIYRILNGTRKMPEGFGVVAEYLLGIWKKRGLPLDPPDIQWCIRYIDLARRMRNGEKVKLEPTPWESFTESEAETMERLIYGRKSIRQFKPEPVPDEMIRRILKAGLYAPHGCNVGCTRFLVLKDPEEQKLVRSDIPIENCVMIVVLQELSMYKTLRFDEYVPQNLYFDAGAAADHICLMAHALGLGSCWLTHGEETQKRLREHFNLSPTMTSRNHIIIGWPGEETIKSERMSLDEAILN
ncbi:nitroreductase family protein [Candidatus Bathyarchaeota archaeon]|nr:nitroreductase family protein [Candidatus Bathyarchaeota archaeon]